MGSTAPSAVDRKGPAPSAGPAFHVAVRRGLGPGLGRRLRAARGRRHVELQGAAAIELDSSDVTIELDNGRHHLGRSHRAWTSPSRSTMAAVTVVLQGAATIEPDSSDVTIKLDNGRHHLGRGHRAWTSPLSSTMAATTSASAIALAHGLREEERPSSLATAIELGPTIELQENTALGLAMAVLPIQQGPPSLLSAPAIELQVAAAIELQWLPPPRPPPIELLGTFEPDNGRVAATTRGHRHRARNPPPPEHLGPPSGLVPPPPRRLGGTGGDDTLQKREMYEAGRRRLCLNPTHHIAGSRRRGRRH